MKIFLISFCIWAISPAECAKSYCEMPCTKYQAGCYHEDKRKECQIPHIACKDTRIFQNSCTKLTDVPLDDKLRKIFVKTHNHYRNILAGGSHPNFPKACRMATLQWDKELEKFATLNVKQCDFEHDHCHISERFHLSGQNLVEVYTTNVTASAEEAAYDWYIEIKDTLPSDVSSVPKPGRDIFHFLTMMHENTTHLGCAISSHVKDSWDKFFITCDYSALFSEGGPLYRTCEKAGSECEAGINPEFPNLCSVNEKFDVNNYNGVEF